MIVFIAAAVMVFASEDEERKERYGEFRFSSITS